MKCGNCGSTFDPADVVYHREDYGEKIACCPVCGVSDLIETEECKLCGKEFEDSELCEGFCLECLWDAIDYDTALDYLKETGTLAEFFLNGWGCGKLEHSSVEFDLFLEETFRRNVALDKLNAQFGGSSDFLRELRYWILPNHDKGDFGRFGCEFAEWYAEKQQKSKQGGRT